MKWGRENREVSREWLGERDFSKEMGLGWTLWSTLGPHGSMDLGSITVQMPGEGWGKILSHHLQLPFLPRAGFQLPATPMPSMCPQRMVLMHLPSIWQAQFGRHVTDCSSSFCMFKSNTKDLLFRDDTQCLARVGKTTYESYLGADYITAVANLRKCSTSSE